MACALSILRLLCDEHHSVISKIEAALESVLQVKEVAGLFDYGKARSVDSFVVKFIHLVPLTSIPPPYA